MEDSLINGPFTKVWVGLRELTRMVKHPGLAIAGSQLSLGLKGQRWK